MKKIKKSSRGLTFSFDANNTFNIGTEVTYVVDSKSGKIIILPSIEQKKKATVSRKRTGESYKPLLDIRSKEVRQLVSSADYLEVEVLEDTIVVNTYIEEQHKNVERKGIFKTRKSNKVIKLEEIIPIRKTSSFVLDRSILNKVSGGEDFAEQVNGFADGVEFSGQGFGGFNTNMSSDIEQVYKVISLFCGSGMLDYPFAKSDSFEVVFAIDNDKHACESYRHNVGDHVVCGDVSDINGKDLTKSKLLIGGVPCTPYSNANRHTRLEDHGDSKLLLEYIRLVKESDVDIFVLENVPQLLTACEGEQYKQIMAQLSDYDITASIVTDCEVGGYTTRSRAIICGSKIGKITLPNIVVSPFKTVKQALSKVTDKWFNNKDVTIPRQDTKMRMSYVPQGGNWEDIPEELRTDNCNKSKKHSNCYLRLDEDKPACTIVNWRKPPLIHPHEDRTFSVAEASALSGFDEDFEFHGKLSDKQQQCGNGVPYAIGKFVMNAVKKVLDAFYMKEKKMEGLYA